MALSRRRSSSSSTSPARMLGLSGAAHAAGGRRRDDRMRPDRQRRTIQPDPLPGEDLALPVKRRVIAILGDQDMGEKTGTGQALSDRTLRSGRLMNGPAGPAAIARPADADDPKPRRHMIEHLADSLTDHMQLAAAAGADLVLRIEPLSLLKNISLGKRFTIEKRSGGFCIAPIEPGTVRTRAPRAGAECNCIE